MNTRPDGPDGPDARSAGRDAATALVVVVDGDEQQSGDVQRPTGGAGAGAGPAGLVEGAEGRSRGRVEAVAAAHLARLAKGSTLLVQALG